MNRKLRPILSLLLAAALLLPSGWLAPAAEASAPEIPVILYHRVVDNATDDWTHTSLDDFKKQMKYLNDNGYDTLSAEQYVNILEGTEQAPDKPILLTFDDATPDFITHALPVLKQYGMKSVQFVISDWIGGGYSMSTEQLEALTDESSVSLQNHSKTHNGTNDSAAGEVWTSQITKEQAVGEIAATNTYLHGITGKQPVLLAYPYGAYNANAEAAAEENGIKYAFKVGYPNQGDYAMGRHYMKRNTTLSQFATMVGGPAPTEQADTITVYHETFSGGKGLAFQSGGASLTPVTGKVFAGNDDGAALYVSNRSNTWDAADFKFADVGLANGETYTVTVKGFVDADAVVPSGGQTFLQTVNSYKWHAGADFIAGSAFTMTKDITVDTSKDTALRVQSNETGKSVPFYIGDILITKPADQSGINADFENGIGAWKIRSNSGGGSVEGTVADNHTPSGANSLKVTVSTQYNGPILDVMGKMHRGHKYRLSAWVKMAPGQAATSLRISVQSGDSTYTNVSANLTAMDGQWVELSGEYTVATTPSVLNAYVETAQTPAAPVTFYMDDFKITHLGAVAAPKPIQNLTPIKDVYADDFLIGTAVGDAEFDGTRLELLKKHHNVVTAENAMKPDYVYNTSREFDFTAEDALVAKIKEHNLLLHGHVLVWHQQMPTWLSTAADGTPLSRETALANLRTHIETVMEHFGDDVISWDVVNEAMNDNPSNPANWKASLRNSPWKAALGEDYVEQSFLIAREVLDEHPNWNIKLYYNDYNDDNQNKATAIANMVKELNDKYALTHPGKLLIDGVGMQAHYNLNTKPENVEMSLKRFIDLDVEVSVTEIDLTAGSNSVQTEKEAKAQGYLYSQLMNIYKKYAANIARVTFWGLNDATSWRASQSPLLFDKDLQAKPAYYGVIDPDTFIEENPPADITINQSTAKYGTPVIDGTIDGIWSQTTEIPINRFQMAWQGASGTAKALWDDSFLYVLFQVNNAELDKSSTDAYKQDSVEVFLDQNNEKSFSYQADDGQYRVNYDNETSFNPASIAAGFVSATKVSGTNYTVEVKIPLSKVTPANDTKLGFDVQINDGKAGDRQSVASWNDTTGQGYQDTSVYGELTLIGKSANPSDSTGGIFIPSAGKVEETVDGIVITPVTKTEGNRVTGQVSDDNLKKALELASPAADGNKQIFIEVPKQGGANAYEVQLPAQSLNGEQNFELRMQTELATLAIPSDMLSDTAENAVPITIRVAKASTENLDAATLESIGNRPVLDLSVIVGNETMEWNNPSAPVTISVPYAPTADELANPDSIVVWYIDSNGVVTAIPNGRYDVATGTVVFQTTHFSTYAVASVVKSFGDLSNVPWAMQAIEAMAARGIIKGISEDTFSPSDSIKRADFIALLVRALELQGSVEIEEMFSDVLATDYYYDELAIAVELGIVSGFGDGTFRPDNAISRQDMMVLAARALAAAGMSLEGGGSLDAYSDAATVSEYAVDSAASLSESGIVNGKNGKLAPNDSLTRAEAAVILYRIWSL
ncbi:endo-1,4-beta-xylanase [Paenibacillus sp. LHD-117]|uniref:endo-1,4-beta-xylanase n=1 Tax=Paenibacillus sp. LHD-117 TaxID=3071412 RepID=UPI0027E11454|nr:endo-1,4-beta-xylanase [Paenibacillus sp. LHD-117]MDQ6418780.1 endo-1,4-beta-xylanase [Paenibacillus sp. LHD-117]